MLKQESTLVSGYWAERLHNDVQPYAAALWNARNDSDKPGADKKVLQAGKRLHQSMKKAREDGVSITYMANALDVKRTTVIAWLKNGMPVRLP